MPIRFISATFVAVGLILPALVQAEQPGVGAAVITATAPGRGTLGRVAEITASVAAIDAANRAVAVRGPSGDVLVLRVGPEVKNPDQVRVGDLVVVRP